MKKLLTKLAFIVALTFSNPVKLVANELYLDCDLLQKSDDSRTYQAREFAEGERKKFVYFETKEINGEIKITKLDTNIDFLIFEKTIDESKVTNARYFFKTIKGPVKHHSEFDISRVTGELNLAVKGKYSYQRYFSKWKCKKGSVKF